mmetsp:Transcript_36084/g.56341  ORF Transcript_36084/g.56341 Transcript_36084/m.56341 type:complete len:166 (-) Transcript_36084:1338-1835(-)
MVDSSSPADLELGAEWVLGIGFVERHFPPRRCPCWMPWLGRQTILPPLRMPELTKASVKPCGIAFRTQGLVLDTNVEGLECNRLRGMEANLQEIPWLCVEDPTAGKLIGPSTARPESLFASQARSHTVAAAAHWPLPGSQHPPVRCLAPRRSGVAGSRERISQFG